MDNVNVGNDSSTKIRFMVGVLLAWVPFLLFVLPIFASVFRGLSTNKATGLGAVAGGVSEALVMFGFTSLIVTQIAAIFLLVRSFQKGHALRGVLSALTICCSSLLLAVGVLFAWILIRTHQ